MKTLLNGVLLFCALAVSQESTSIAILSLQGNGISAAEADVLTDELRTVLVQTGRFNVLERNNMESILQEQGFQMSGCTSSECAVEAGKLLGVQKMIAGSVGKLGALYNISVRIFDVETGRIEKTESKRHSGSVEQLLDVMKEICYALSDTVPEEPDLATMAREALPGKQKPDPFSQRKSTFSIKAGLTSTTTTRQSEGKIGFVISGAYSFNLLDHVSLQPELIYATRNFQYVVPEETMRFKYIQMALIFAFHVAPLSNQSIRFHFSAGPAYSYSLSATKKVYSDTQDLKEYDGRNLIENSEFSLLFGPGLGFQLGTLRLFLEGRYELGLTNLFKDESAWLVGKARVIHVLAGITF